MENPPELSPATLTKATKVKYLPSRVYQLPLWGGEQRGVSNAIARSALFNVANSRKGARKNLKRVMVASLHGIDITYTGEELRQEDEDVLLQILHIARLQPLGEHVPFTAYSMLKELGWTSNADSYKRLVDCVDRLKASSVEIRTRLPTGEFVGYTGSLIRSFRWKSEDGSLPLRRWEVLLEKEIIGLFGPEQYTKIDWEFRLALPPLAKWLHTFYNTHAQPFSYKVDTLYGLTGSEIRELRQFRYKLRQALQVLVERGFFLNAYVEPKTDLVVVTRAPNKRHATAMLS